MMIVKIEDKSPYDINPFFIIVPDEDGFAGAEKLFRKHHPDKEIGKMTVLSGRVINAWAQ